MNTLNTYIKTYTDPSEWLKIEELFKTHLANAEAKAQFCFKSHGKKFDLIAGLQALKTSFASAYIDA